jgi:hypothetical protein
MSKEQILSPLKGERGAAMIEKKCKSCKKPILVRMADHKRGWGNYCNKACKASQQARDTNISGPDYRASGKKVSQMKCGKYAKSKFSGGRVIETYDDGTELFYANFSNELNSDI